MPRKQITPPAFTKNQFKKIVEKLLSEKDIDVQSCLSLAAQGSAEILELILKDKRTNINAYLMGEYTALDLADMQDMTENVELLKKYGAKSGLFDE
ncbi:MAG: hypothetical protein ACD_82C00045G0003 [uncultured bacterium]|jgi:hypothetical protein|nr:MAG: hypothetical protein ACD_82C00045G0003 [uncultured bacterium]KKP29201.1 MAG: hypothetical protein UR12_C0013G0031 [candidate division TM6 bacterium GW2011_GWF2_30_66]